MQKDFSETSLAQLPLSLVIITKDEEANIARAIQSAPFAGEVLVLDSGSQDQTCEIAKSLGARVEHQDWLGFGPQKQRAVELARFDWIFSLDADEAISEGLAEELKSFFRSGEHLKAETQATAFAVPRKSWYLGRWILHGGWYPDRQTRLFHKKHSRWSEALIHEKVLAPKLRHLKQDLEHYVFSNMSHQVKTNDHYSSLQAQEFLERGGRFSLFRCLTKPWVKFIECYFIKAGFRDGFPGFFIAVSAAYSVFLRWSKIWESQK